MVQAGRRGVPREDSNMESAKAKFSTVDEYVASFPAPVQAQLQALRQTIHKAVPGLSERLSYGIAAFTLGGKYLVYMGGFKDHVSIYPITPKLCWREPRQIRSWPTNFKHFFSRRGIQTAPALLLLRSRRPMM